MEERIIAGLKMVTETVSARALRIGDVFLSEGVWFKILKIESLQTLLDILGEVVSCNSDNDYAVGDSYWINFAPDEQIIIKKK